MKTIIFTLLCFVCSNICAQAVATDLQNKLANLQNMSADFTQVVSEESGQVLQKTAGKMLLQRPNKFKWQTTSAPAQLIITNGKMLWIYDVELKQVTIKNFAASIKQTPLWFLLNSPKNLLKDFTVSKIKNNTTTINWYRLEPKNKGSNSISILVGFLKNNLQRVMFVNQLGQKTMLLFTNIIVNKKVAENFNFIIPADVDVIDETKI